MQCTLQDRCQSIQHHALVGALCAFALRNQAQHTFCRESIGEVLKQALSLLLAEAIRVHYVKPQLDAAIHLVHILPARAAGSSELEFQLIFIDGAIGCDSYHGDILTRPVKKRPSGEQEHGH